MCCRVLVTLYLLLNAVTHASWIVSSLSRKPRFLLSRSTRTTINDPPPSSFLVVSPLSKITSSYCHFENIHIHFSDRIRYDTSHMRSCLYSSTIPIDPLVPKSLKEQLDRLDDDHHDQDQQGVGLLFSLEEERIIDDLFLRAATINTTTTINQTSATATTPDPEQVRQALLETLSNLSPTLIVKLRQQSTMTHPNPKIQQIGIELHAILNDRMELAKTTLLHLLNAGEVRKLDAYIGQAARQGQLDVAFFNVLAMNLKDAVRQERDGENEGTAGTSTIINANNKNENQNNGLLPVATRSQVLQHIYTRCQEEVEKSLPAGTALLNKLLRTDQASIRQNLYRHYLTPQPQEIQSPDGRTIQLKTNSMTKATIPINDVVGAIGEAVIRVRTMERAGSIDRVDAAALVESCRNVAKEARAIIGEAYGPNSDELIQFQDGLQPVFRPSSPTSSYIQGNA